MESNWLPWKLARWSLILQEYNFDIVHKPSRVNENANGLSQNPSSNEEDTTWARWHGEVDLKAIPTWRAFTYLCILLGCLRDVPQGNTSSGNSNSDDDEQENNGALNIHLDLPIMAYLQANEVLVDWHPRSGIGLSTRQNNSDGKVIFYYVCGQIGEYM